MTDQEKVFVETYLANGFNALQAAATAGYVDPHANAWRIRRNEDVSAAIEERLAEMTMSANEVLAEIASIAKSDLGDFLKVDDVGGYAVIDLKEAKKTGKLKHLKTYKFDRQTGMHIELHDKLAALDKLCKALGLYTQKVDVTSKGEQIKLYQGFDPEEV